MTRFPVRTSLHTEDSLGLDGLIKDGWIGGGLREYFVRRSRNERLAALEATAATQVWVATNALAEHVKRVSEELDEQVERGSDTGYLHYPKSGLAGDSQWAKEFTAYAVRMRESARRLEEAVTGPL